MVIRVGDPVDYDGYGDERLALIDRFDGTELDTSIWNRRWRWGPEIIINQEVQYYPDRDLPGATTLRYLGTHAEIVADHTPPELLDQVKNQPYLSTAISTYDKFSIGHHRAEVELFLPGNEGTQEMDGAFPAFWAQGQFDAPESYGGYKVLPELDYWEGTGNDPLVMHFSTHADPGRRFNRVPGARLVSTSSRYLTKPGRGVWGRWAKFGGILDGERVLFQLDDQWVAEKPAPKSWLNDWFFNINMALGDGRTGFGSAIAISDQTVFPMVMGMRNFKVWPIAPKGRTIYMARRFMKEVDTGLSGAPIFQPKASVTISQKRPIIMQEQEIRVPYIDADGNEQPATDDRGLIQAGQGGDPASPKEVIWGCANRPNAWLYLHRHIDLVPQDFEAGGRYTLTVKRLNRNIPLPQLSSNFIQKSKGQIDVSPGNADDAYVASVMEFVADENFIKLINVRHL